jgi:hypothetical protein
VHVADEVVSAAAQSNTSYFVTSDGTLWGSGSNYLWTISSEQPEIWTEPTLIASGLGTHAVFRFNAGLSAIFTVSASGAEPLVFEWQKDGMAIPGATSPSLALANAQADATGFYTVIVTNAEGSVQAGFELEANLPPVIKTEPQSAEILDGDEYVLSVEVEGTEPLTYVWRKDGADIPDAISASLEISDAQDVDSGDYSVVVSNPAGTATSDFATIAVHYRPRRRCTRRSGMPRAISPRAARRARPARRTCSPRPTRRFARVTAGSTSAARTRRTGSASPMCSGIPNGAPIRASRPMRRGCSIWPSWSR